MNRLHLLAAGLALILTGCGERAVPGESAVPDVEPGGLALIGGQLIDGTGKTIIPGLVNLHVHYREGPEEIQRQFRSQLYYGVTTARSIGSDSAERVAFLLEANAGRPDFPRAYTAGLGFSRPGGFNAAGRNAPETEEDARALVRDQIALGEADFGTLETGNVADLVVLNADPLADIRNTLEINRVMRLGEWVDRSGFVPAP